MAIPRVLWLTKGLARGGAEQLIVSCVPRLQSGGVDIEVASVLSSEADHVRFLSDQGVTVHDLGGRGTADPRWVRRLAMLLDAGSYDIVHTHAPLPASFARILARRGIRFVHTEHNVWPSYRTATRFVNSMTLGRNDVVFGVSDGVSDSIRQRTSGQRTVVRTLRHGIDHSGFQHGPDARSAARALIGTDAETPIIGTVGNLSAKKHQASLIAAVAEVRRDVPEAVLVIVGSGPLRDQLEDVARECGIATSVRFLGSRPDVPKLLPGMDVFVLSSRYEGLPIALLEAMASGVACISTDVGGVSEVLRDRSVGRLVQPGSPNAIAKEVRLLLENESERRVISEAGRQLVISEFSIDNAVAEYRKTYAHLLAS